jgi:hypothetical protein
MTALIADARIAAGMVAYAAMRQVLNLKPES